MIICIERTLHTNQFFFLKCEPKFYFCFLQWTFNLCYLHKMCIIIDNVRYTVFVESFSIIVLFLF